MKLPGQWLKFRNNKKIREALLKEKQKVKEEERKEASKAGGKSMWDLFTSSIYMM